MKRATKVLIIATAAAWIGWDFIVWGGAPGDTISEVVAATAWRWPVLPLAFGVLASHFFWSGKPMKGIRTDDALLLFASIALAISAVGIKTNPVLPLGFGIVIGRLFWPQPGFESDDCSEYDESIR